MEPHYTYTPATEFIQQLQYDYAETYSLQRGDAFKAYTKQLKEEWLQLKKKQETKIVLSATETQRLLQLNEWLGQTQYLLNKKGQLHYSAVKTHTFLQTDPIAIQLHKALQIPVKDVPLYLCAPIYRDALIFYKNDAAIVATLNVCLSCQYIETVPFHYINADYTTYPLLKQFFISVGHTVE